MPLRTITVWCPDWSAIAADIDPGTPAAVLRANRVISCTPAASAAGVHYGQRRRLAQQRCPHLVVVEHDHRRDARRFEPVIAQLGDIAARFEIVEPGWLQLDARGPARYFGGEVEVASRLVDMVGECVPSVRIARAVASDVGCLGRTGAGVGVGVADGPAFAVLAAQLAARTEEGIKVVPAGASRRFIAPLPIGWLARVGAASIEHTERFARLGLRTCGDLASLGIADVMSRFGHEGARAHRVAGGDDDRHIIADELPVDRSVRYRFDEPVGQSDRVVFVGKRLADQLGASLRAGGKVCVRLEITIVASSGSSSQRLWYRDQGMPPAAMVERIRWQLEGWASSRGAGVDGVTELRLSADEVRADDGRQIGLWGGRSQADTDAARTITRLEGILGDESVWVPEWVGGRLPTERYRWVATAGVDIASSAERLDRDRGPWPGSTVLAPAQLGVTPMEVSVIGDDGSQLGVSGRGEISRPPTALVIDSTTYPVVAWAGPWPVEQRWWDAARSRRVARLQLVTEHHDAYLVGIEHGRWWLLASYR